MRRTPTLALLTAALMVGGSSAALAQAGPPSDVPQPPAQAQGSAQTGQDNSAQGRATTDNAQAQGSAQTGQENSAEGRATAREKSGFDVPADEDAREDGRAFGEQRAAEAQARGDDATDTDADDDTTGDAQDGDLDDAADPDLPEGELPEGELPDETPEEADQARGVLATITATFQSVLTTLQNLLGMATSTV